MPVCLERLRIPPPSPFRLAILIWLFLGLAITTRTLLSPASHTVFPIFAQSSAHWWQDLPLYADYKPLDYYRYPPVFALALTPLSLLGCRLGGVLWSWLSIFVLLVGLLQYTRLLHAHASSPSRNIEGRFLLLMVPGALPGLWNAQSNALVVGLLLLAAVQVAKAAATDLEPAASSLSWWWAALALALAVWIKLTPLAPALLLAVLWPRRLGLRLAALLLLIALVPFLTRPPIVVLNHYQEWHAHLTTSSSKRWPGFRDAWTLWQAVHSMASRSTAPIILDSPLHSLAYRIAQLGTAGALLAWCLLQRARRLPVPALVHLTLSIAMAWLMLFGPASEHATYVFVAPALCWAFLHPNAWPAGRWLLRLAFVLIMVLGWRDLTRPLESSLPLFLASLPLGAGLFVLWLLGFAQTLQATTCQVPAVQIAGSHRSSGLAA